MTGSGTSFTVQVNTSRPFGKLFPSHVLCLVKTSKRKSEHPKHLVNQGAKALVRRSLAGHASISHHDSPRLHRLMMHVQLKSNHSGSFWARGILPLPISPCLRFGARAALQSLCWHGWRRVSPDGGHSAGGQVWYSNLGILKQKLWTECSVSDFGVKFLGQCHSDIIVRSLCVFQKNPLRMPVAARFTSRQWFLAIRSSKVHGPTSKEPLDRLGGSVSGFNGLVGKSTGNQRFSHWTWGFHGLSWKICVKPIHWIHWLILIVPGEFKQWRITSWSPADHQLITDDRRWPSHVLDVPMSLKVSLLRRATATCLMTTTRCFELKLLSCHCRNPHINGRSVEMWVTQRSSERRHST